MLPGAYIICETSLPSIIKFSGDDYEIDNLRIIGKEDITSGLELNADGIVKNILVKQVGSGKTMTNAITVTSSNIATVFGRAKEIIGIITNKYSDIDGNSEITIS